MTNDPAVVEDDYPVLNSAGQIDAEAGRQLVPVPEWKRRVWLYEPSGTELDEYRRPMYVPDGPGSFHLSLDNSNLRLLVYMIRDANGNRIYPETKSGIQQLGALPSGGTERLGKVARRLAGLSDESGATPAGNSASETTGDSTSG